VSWTDHIYEILLTGVIAIMAFFGKRELNKVDKLDDSKADKEDLAELMKRLDAHLEDDKELRRDLTRSVAEVREHVARIAGRLES